MQFEPFAVQLYNDFRQGKSVKAIAAETKIPEERIAARLRAAKDYLETREKLEARRKAIAELGGAILLAVLRQKGEKE